MDTDAKANAGESCDFAGYLAATDRARSPNASPSRLWYVASSISAISGGNSTPNRPSSLVRPDMIGMVWNRPAATARSGRPGRMRLP